MVWRGPGFCRTSVPMGLSIGSLLLASVPPNPLKSLWNASNISDVERKHYFLPVNSATSSWTPWSDTSSNLRMNVHKRTLKNQSDTALSVFVSKPAKDRHVKDPVRERDADVQRDQPASTASLAHTGETSLQKWKRSINPNSSRILTIMHYKNIESKLNRKQPKPLTLNPN